MQNEEVRMLNEHHVVLTSTFRLLHSAFLYTFAFAADQNARHALRGIARFVQRRVRTMPLSMVGIVPGRASFAAIALTTIRAMQNDLVRPRSPILVNIKFDRLRSSGCGLGD